MSTLNELYSSRSMRRRYEVWFLRMGLADGAGAWWFRYLLMNPGRAIHPGREHSPENPQAMPVQIWATWFPSGGKPQTFIQGFPVHALEISPRSQSPFCFRIGENRIDENSCRGQLHIDGHSIRWDLQYRSTFCVTLSNKGWIGFSRTPHSDAVFSGEIALDGRSFAGDALGFGVQGHNSGYRHRNFWTWTHACFPGDHGPATTLEALVYEMPFGMRFRKAVLWHDGQRYVFRNLREQTRDRENLRWNFQCVARDGLRLNAAIDGAGPSVHRLPYNKTDGKGSFEVANNSLASATLLIEGPNAPAQALKTTNGAVLEMVA